MHRWKISEAKSRFTQVIRDSRESPQIICNRDKPVSAVVDMKLFGELMKLKDKQDKPSIAQLLAELKAIHAVEPVELEVPGRKNRPNQFEEISDELDL